MLHGMILYRHYPKDSLFYYKICLCLFLHKIYDILYSYTGFLYLWSPVIGFFGEAILETINEKRYGISTGFLELLLERLGWDL